MGLRASPCSLRSRPPSLCEGGAIGVVCFSLGDVAGMTEWVCGNDEVLVGMTVQIRGVVGGPSFPRPFRASPCCCARVALRFAKGGVG